MTRILVLDDNADIVALLRMVLEQRGYQVVSGRNGREGIHLLGQAAIRPDLIICNLRMPLMDGMAFLDMLRQQAEWSAIPVVMLTAMTAPDYREAAFAHGANAFLPKPFKLDELNRAMQNLGVTPKLS